MLLLVCKQEDLHIIKKEMHLVLMNKCLLQNISFCETPYLRWYGVYFYI